VGTKGNADQQSTHRTQRRQSVTQALDRIRKVASESERLAVIHPRWEPYAGKPPVRFCAGGAMQIACLPLPASFAAFAHGRLWQILLQKAADWGLRNWSPNFDC